MKVDNSTMNYVEHAAPCIDISAASNRQSLVSEKIHENSEGLAASKPSQMRDSDALLTLVGSRRLLRAHLAGGSSDARQACRPAWSQPQRLAGPSWRSVCGQMLPAVLAGPGYSGQAVHPSGRLAARTGASRLAVPQWGAWQTLWQGQDGVTGATPGQGS